MDQMDIFDAIAETEKSNSYNVIRTDYKNEHIIKSFKTEIEAIKYQAECEKWSNNNIYKYFIKSN